MEKMDLSFNLQYNSIQFYLNSNLSSNSNNLQFKTPTRQPILQILAYTPAQNTQSQNIQTGLTINTQHSNALPKYTTSRNLSRPPLQTIPNNPISYCLTSTNPNSTQHSTTNNIQLNTLNPFSTFQ